LCEKVLVEKDEQKTTGTSPTKPHLSCKNAPVEKTQELEEIIQGENSKVSMVPRSKLSNRTCQQPNLRDNSVVPGMQK
jgi:hypothetical protein